MHWVHGEANLADALTKEGAEAVLQDFMARKQKWSIVHDPEMRSAKKRKAGGQDRLQQIHSVCAKHGYTIGQIDHQLSQRIPRNANSRKSLSATWTTVSCDHC